MGVSTISWTDQYHIRTSSYLSGWKAEDSDNPHILKWWTAAHDRLLRRLVRTRKVRGKVPLDLCDELLEITPPEVVEDWEAEDPSILGGHWEFTLQNFVNAYAAKLGLTATWPE